MGRMVIFPTPNPLPPPPPPSPPLPPLRLSYSCIAPSLPLPLSCASSLSLSLPSPSPLQTTSATATTISIATSSSPDPPSAPSHTPSPQGRSIFHSTPPHSESLYAEEYFRPRLSNQTRRSLQELARQQFYHSHRQSNNDQNQNRLETLQEQCTTSRQRRQPPSNRKRPRSWSESASGGQRRHTHSYPVYASQGPADTRITPPKPRRIPSPAESLSYLSRILRRLSRFNCACGTSQYPPSKQQFHSHSSIYLPRVPTVNNVSLSTTSTSSTSVHYSQQRPGAKRTRHLTARSSRAVTTGRGGIGTRVDKGKGARRDNGKQRASSGSGSQPGSLIENLREPPQSRVLSSLSLSTTHSWCPYCQKTIPTEDQSDHHHQLYRQHSLISPTPTPYRTHSSPSRSRSSSPSQSPTQPHSIVSIHTTQSLPQTAAASSFISDLDLVSAPDVLFTFNHPFSALASTSFSAAPNTVAEREEGIAAEAKSKETEEPTLPVTTHIYNRIRKGVETSSWLSFPSADGGDTKIRSFTGLSRSSSAARGGKGAAAATDNSPVPSKRKSWSFFPFRTRRSSLPDQSLPSVHQDQDRSALVKSQPSLVIEPQRQNPLWDSQRTQPRETTHNHPQYQQHRETVLKSTSKVGSIPVPDSKMRMLSTQEQAVLPVGNSSRSQSFSPGTIMNRGGEASSAPSSRIRGSITFDQDKLLPVITSDHQPPSHSVIPLHPQMHLQVQPEPQPQRQKHQRRKSFIPSALMTSNLAKFVSGSHTSPTSTLAQTNSPRSPRSPLVPAPKTQDHKDEDVSLAVGTLLTIEQFKWGIICCCNEIKSRATKQRFEASRASSQAAASPTLDVTVTPIAAPQRKLEKSKTGRFNGYYALPPQPPQAVETLPKEPRSILQSLLAVMISSTEEANGQRGGMRSDGVDVYAQDSTAATFYHSPSSQPRSHSLMSLMGTNGTAESGAEATKKANSINQPSQHSSSFSSLPSPVSSSLATLPSPIPTSSASTHSQQQQQPTRLRSKKSQSKLAITQATDDILNPLSLEDLVRLMSYTLSVAPEQWIPWHMYDFFVRPQGMKYRDMIELLPTQSQRILKSVLETVDALMDYAVMVAMAPRQMAGGNATTATVPPSTAAGGAAGGGGSVGYSQPVNGLRQQLSQAHIKARNDALTVLNKSRLEVSVASLVAALSSVDSPPPQQSSSLPLSKSPDDSGMGDSVQQEIAVRAHKRRVILDSLAGLVFQSRHDVSANFSTSNSPSQDRDSLSMMMPRQTLEIMAEERSKSKRRNSSAVTSSGTAGTAAGQTAATLTIRIQAAEREREAVLKAFENLVNAFEEEYHPHKLAKGDQRKDKAVATGINNVATTSAIVRPVSMQGVHPLGQASAPRHTRPLPGPRVPPGMELAAVRSLSLPPWRKSLTPGSQVQTGQHQPNNRSHHNVFESSAEVPGVGSRWSSSSALVLIAVPRDTVTQAKRYPADQHNIMNRVMGPLDSVPAPVMTANMVKENVRPNSESAKMRPKPKWIVSSSTPTPTAALATPTLARATPSRSQTGVSATLSATWSTWKDHLLVLEEEEYVILDLSDSDDDDGSKASTDEKRHDARQRNDDSIHNENTQ